MKYYIINILASLIYSLWSCNETNLKIVTKAKNDWPPSQCIFDSILKITYEENEKIENLTEKEEYFKMFDKKLLSLIDSINVFVNWEGTIEDFDLSIDDKGKLGPKYKYATISCIIVYVPNEQRKISFISKMIIEQKDLYADSIYAKLGRLSKGSKVYFDGFIQRDYKRNIKYSYNDELLDESNPKYMFNLLDITSFCRVDTLKANLLQLLNMNLKVSELLRKALSKEISKSEYISKTQTLYFPKMRQSLKSLNNSDKEYFERHRNYLSEDFWRDKFNTN